MTKPISKWRLTRTLCVAGVVFLWLGATNRGGDRSEIELMEAHRTIEGLTDAHLSKNLVDPRFSYGNRKNFRGSAAEHTVLISQQAVYRTLEEVKKEIAIPLEIRVAFKECGGPDSYYDNGSHEIIVCYELIEAYSDLFSGTLRARTARDEATKGAVVSMFLHELAHALIDRLDLAITGREEDAADQFSTLMLINSLPGGEAMAMDGARSFKSLAILEQDLEKDYSDAHSLDEQRFYHTICLVYGRRPERYEYLVRDGSIPRERAFECEEGYARVNKSWQKLLSPYLIRTHRP